MKKLFYLIILLLFQCTPSQPKFNGDFELLDNKSGLPLGWKFPFSKTKSKGYVVTMDSAIKQHGKYAISIQNVNSASTYGIINYKIEDIIKCDSITLRGYIKAEGVISGYAGLWMRTDDGKGNSLAFNNMLAKGIKGTTPWKFVSISIPYNREKVRSLNIGGLLTGDGRAWFDNMEVLVDGKPLNKAKFSKKIILNAEADTAYQYSSGIKQFKLNPQLLINLTAAGQFWSFLKYHHPAVAKGDYNWDAELFRLLPPVIKAKNNKSLSTVLEQFLDKLPTPGYCDKCAEISSTSFVIRPEYGMLLNNPTLSKSLQEKLKYVINNRNLGENYYISMAENTHNPQFTNERVYSDMFYPDTGYRLLALYRYWAMINYFFPSKYLIGENWNTVLTSSLSEFVDARNEVDYSLATLKLIAKIKDTHAGFYGDDEALNKFKGNYLAALQAKFIEGKLIITDLNTDTLDVKFKLAIGDIIQKINDVYVDSLVKKYLPYTSASNYDTQLRDMPTDFLLRSNEPKVKLTISRNGNVFNYRVPTGNLASFFKDRTFEHAVPYKLIDQDIGYVYPGKYKNSMLNDIKKKFSTVKGIIIDMRCYPADFMPFTFGSYIKDKPSSFVKLTAGSIGYPGAFHFKPEIVNGQEFGRPDNAFKGKIIIIVNSTTQSQAEYTTIAFQSSPNVKVIGSTTAGADGDVSNIYLPGGIFTRISGLGVYYPDGTHTQRVGVRIDHKIYPTIKGITQGRDELMEKALELLKAAI
ncbi:S41 family peptidase [Pedobacter duraquae]|uniref:C-terminal processing protease CtpA/Prc n=1 Tax=Pedobacter duraquae TaxID=425511 RepID=A0A4R6IFF6_9SPHI|nr:S41 family peptidase [Pedobacter duraquae]TDO20812.1 C-terminal processing protease CtpA/Prc [Pedobacter duraquae]